MTEISPSVAQEVERLLQCVGAGVAVVKCRWTKDGDCNDVFDHSHQCLGDWPDKMLEAHAALTDGAALAQESTDDR